ncbi:auxin-induced protein X15-like [Corylus avellana]|uniref:auxin-induced protein X15-like n=1 Tax=Corylus avellana TaxID=13451 RepID=UPI00286D2689|nr:auxin-induced protein X15-like [Corylus avellana]
MHSFNWLFEFLERIHPKNRYARLTKAKKAKANAVRVLKGHVALYVGKEEKRYEVPVKYLSLQSFKELLAQSQPYELDIKNDGPIVLPCTIELYVGKEEKRYEVPVKYLSL